MPLLETLFAGSTVLLFGREFRGLGLLDDSGALVPPGVQTAPGGGGAGGAAPATSRAPRGAPPVLRALQDKLMPRGAQSDLTPMLARIYGFSYLGSYYKLPEPTVLVVYGPGESAPARLDPGDLGIVGVEFKSETFTDGITMWTLDQADYTVRIDITPGWLADVLLEPGMSDGTNMTTRLSSDNGGRGSSTGRPQMVGRGHMVGRGNSG